MSLSNEARAGQLFARPSAYLDRNPFVARRAAIVASLAGAAADGGILDIGCGDGSISLPLLEACHSLTLVDASAEMLSLAETRVPSAFRHKVTLRHGRVEQLDLPQADLVICLGVLAHVEEVGPLVTRLANLTQRGGLLLVQATDVDRLLGRVAYRRDTARRRARHEAAPPARTSGARLIEQATACGLRFVSVQHHALMPPGCGWLPAGVLSAWDELVCRNRILSAFAPSGIFRFEAVR